ncbi:ABC transporter ATP-binding protein [Nemorincola caseinilytica]|uniref:ABC transporter ATP-binding protein n=1 Tax=Nemorincola caseinilytica TaxID=2054315 RepID=A0ABP8NGG3_9BACT
MKRISRLLAYLADQKGKIALYFTANLLGIPFGLATMIMVGPVLQVLFQAAPPAKNAVSGPADIAINYINDIVLRHDRLTALTYVCIAVVLLTLLKNVFLYLAVYILNPIRNNILRKLRTDLFDKTMSLPIGFFTEERKGDLMSRMTNDINEVELSIMSVLEVFIREPLSIIFYISYMVWVNYQLTLVLLVFLPVAGFIIGRISKSLRRSSNAAQEHLGNMMGVIDESLAGMRVIKAFGAETHQRLRFTRLNNMLFRTRNFIAARKELASPMSETMGIIVAAVILWLGGRMVFAGTGFTGPVFITYIGAFWMLIAPFKNLSGAFSNVQKGTAALDRIEHLLSVPNTITEKANAKHLPAFDNNITLRNVHFAYGERTVLQDIDLTIPKGKTVALVGSSGAGKSTLADLIPRFHDVTSGEILIDGTDIRDCKIDDLRRLIGVVSQDPILFNDTLYNNITLGTGGATKERVEEAARIAHADKFILQKSEGYDTVAGDRGARLSGGERQRITIARAVLKNPPILILDEATSSLDTESERLVQEAINKLMQNRTCIVIAHRLSTVQHADEIIVLEKGRIAERGTHATLLAANGIYKKLVEMQQVK